MIVHNNKIIVNHKIIRIFHVDRNQRVTTYFIFLKHQQITSKQMSKTLNIKYKKK